jgi:hypothetical protein
MSAKPFTSVVAVLKANRPPQVHFTAEQFLAHALVDQDVGVHGHADGEHDAREPRQREGAVDHGHDAEDDHAVDHQREVGHHPREEVVGHHEHRDGHQRDEEGLDAAVQVVPPD